MSTEFASATIRKAAATDCSRLLELVHELAVFEKAPNEVTVSLDHFIEAGFGPSPIWWAWVAEVDGEIVAFALYYIRYSTWKGSTLYLEDILVTESMRGKKIGTLLFERIMQDAREKNLPRMSWQVLEWNEPAINFYKKYNASFDGEWVNCSIATT